MAAVSRSHAGIIHSYTNHLVAFEHLNPNSPTNISPDNIILWVGGLGDGLCTVKYPSVLSSFLPSNWSLAEVITSSSYSGWGTGSLARDAQDIAHCVAYFRSGGLRGDNVEIYSKVLSGMRLAQKGKGKEKIVVMGHSTGCQDVMEYLVGSKHGTRPTIDGAILQAPVSDREALQNSIDRHEYEAAVSAARQMLKEGRADEVLPTNLTKEIYDNAPISSYRLLSLLSPDGPGTGDDDYFSSDIADERLRETFGKLPSQTPLLVLWSGEDEFVPGHVDAMCLIKKWWSIIKEGNGSADDRNGGIIKGASHNLQGNNEEIIMKLKDKVAGYLTRLEQSEFRRDYGDSLASKI
jgi:pimeloyl-ACP methyl ester carboxylesterase